MEIDQLKNFSQSQARFMELPDLAGARLGALTLAVNDEFFAPKENLLKPQEPIFIEGKYTKRGKWMDGWETRRRRSPGHDWVIVRLGLRGLVAGVNINTAHFIGNYPESCSIEALDGPQQARRAWLTSKQALWTEILPKTPLKGGSDNLLEIPNTGPWTHLKLNIYPDGGVARFRVYGEAIPSWEQLARLKKSIDLAAIENGGKAVASSDMFFGSRNNLLMPGRAKNMGEGWETKRRRGPGYDWVVIKLGHAGIIKKIEVDTNHFKGNYPESCSLEGACALGAYGSPAGSRSPAEGALEHPSNVMNWRTIVERTKLKAHARHFFTNQIKGRESFTCVRLNIYPDGGISRLRVYGTIDNP